MDLSKKNFPAGAFPFKFTSCVIAATLFLSATTNLHARYYSAPTGRFISADTVVPNADDPQTLNRYAYVRNNPLVLNDPDGHLFWVAAIIIASAWAGTHGQPFNSSSWDNFDFKAAAIAAAASAAGQWGYAAAGMGFGGAIIGGMASGMTSGALGAAMYGGNVMDGMGQGMAQGEIAGLVNGAVGSVGIYNVGAGAGGMANPMGSMAGSYVSTMAMGGSPADARRSARDSFWESTVSNGTQLTYNAIQGPPTSGTYLMGARLREGHNPGLITALKGTISAGLSVFGIGHSAFINADTRESKELDSVRGRGMVQKHIFEDGNSLKDSGHRLGSWFQPLDISFDAIPIPTNGDRGPYNVCTGSCNTYTQHDVLHW